MLKIFCFMDESSFLTNLQPLVAAESPEAEARLSKNDLKTLLTITAKYRTLHDLGKLVASEMETEGLLRLAMDKVIEVTHAQRGFIALVDDRSGSISKSRATSKRATSTSRAFR
jgi:hypothetical protein